MTVKQLLDFSALLDTFSKQAEASSAQASAHQKAAQQTWQQQTGNLNTAVDQLEAEYADTESRRKGWADQYALQAKQWLEELDDPLWHAVKNNCFLQCTSPRDELAGKTEIQLLTFLQERQTSLQEALQKLKGGFLPASMSGAVGKVIPGYKRKYHRQLAQSYTDLCCAAEVLRSCGDIARNRAHTQTVQAQKQRAYDSRRDEQIGQAQHQLHTRTAAYMERFSAALQECAGLGLFAQDAPFHPGIFFRTNPLPEAELPSALHRSADNAQLFFPLSMPLPHQSIFFLTDNDACLASSFTSFALDVLQANSKSQVYFADLEGLGSRYSDLAPLTEHKRIHVWSNEADVRRGLAALSERIAEHHTTGSAPAAPAFLFVETLERNIPMQELSHFFSIAKNGAAAGVIVLFSMQQTVIPERVLADQLQHLENVSVLSLTGNTLPLPGGAGIHISPRQDWQKQVQALLEAENAMKTQNSILPLGKYLPLPGAWQVKSSARGIEIAVGNDPDGSAVQLHLNEEKPYVLIIGDPDVGKSSLEHTICLQIMSNYGPDEVRLAMADYKMGVEFNTYGICKLPSVEAVVNDEDLDAKAAFLRCYVAEMERRQLRFTQLEEQTGQLVRKYEDFRAVHAAHACDTEPMPRLVLLIDEFQSLFNDSTVTAALLSELVRKGRTYGIHLVMASQRAVGDTVNNSFSRDLKEYFTSRFVLRCPQSAARSVLHERCADTGRENSGIAAAPALSKGHAVFNDRMGELESANRRVQCYYPDSRTIATVCQILTELNGVGNTVLLKRRAPSPDPVLPPETCLLLGTSPNLHQDGASAGADLILDDTDVGIRMEQGGQNLVLTGSDVPMVQSITRSAALYMLSHRTREPVHVFGLPDSQVMRGLMAQNDPAYVFHTTEEAIKAELTRQTEAPAVARMNLFVEFDTLSAYALGYSSRTAPEVELLKQVLSNAEQSKSVNLLYAKSFRNLRSQMAYAVQAAPVRLTAIGDSENLRAALPENCRITFSEFDQPRKNAIRAYYCNANSGKWGKVLLFAL